MPNRRVYFLAVNCRKSDLNNQALRIAIARAINREDLLTKFFRSGHKEYHQALHGPYPAKSWAYDSSPVREGEDRLNNVADAKRSLEDAKKEGAGDRAFKLIYPNDDPRVEEAMKELKKQVGAIGITLELKKLDPHEIYNEVEVTQTYDLAYYSHDFESEAYWLWPLFDPSEEAMGSRGSNFLGYGNNGELQQQFLTALSHRRFEDVQKTTRSISSRLEKAMPLIPLWQLDRHLFYRTVLKPIGLPDPLRVFTNIDHWERKE